MWKQIQRRAAPPAFEDAEKQHIANTLNLILPLLLLASLLITVITVVTQAFLASIMIISGGVCMLIAFFLMRHKYLALSAYVVILTTLGVITGALYDGLGVSGVAVSGYAIVIALAGLLLGKRAPIIFALLCTASLMSVYIGEINGLIVSRCGRPDFDDVAINTIIFLTTAVLVRTMISNWLDIVAQVRRNEQVLAQKNRALQSEITERKRAEDALRRAKEAAEAASRAKTVFLGTMSHELRTPLSIIIGYGELLQRKAHGLDCSDFSRDLVKIDTAAHQLLNIVTDVLDFTELDAGQTQLTFDPVDLRAVLDECVTRFEPAAQNKNLRLECSIPDDLPAVPASQSHLTRVFAKLIDNAIKFTPKGSVSICADLVEGEGLPDTPVALDTSKSWVRIQVADTGIGIAPEHQAVIFEAFQQADSSNTRSYEGVGLGLAIARRIVEAMHSHIWVESIPGEGSKFFVLLPVIE